MIYKDISEVPFSTEKVVIINVGTRIMTTLSLMSVLKNCRIPVLLIDCPVKASDSNDFEYFRKINTTYHFDLISLPLKEHGQTLDFIFTNLKAEKLLLVDSDLEVLDSKVVDNVSELMKFEKTFGAGFTHGPCVVNEGDWIKDTVGRYEERMWIPFCMLNVEYVKSSIQNGYSFSCKTFYNIIPHNQKISKFLFSFRKKVFISTISKLFGVSFSNKIPLFVAYDTGADIYQYLKNNKYYHFFGFDANSSVQNSYVIHYGGITRKLLDPDDNNGTLQEEQIKERIIERLKTLYNFEI